MSVRALADEDGTITDTYVFDAFGNETARTGDSENSYGFQGEEQDETGLYYLRARYMDPSTGTFTSMDTYAGRLSDPMSLHKYMFANSNPVKYCDPSGHFTMVETMLAVALVSELAAAVVYGVTVTTTDRIQYNSLGEAIAGSLSIAISAMALGLLFWMMYMVLAVIVSVAFAAVLFALFGIGMSALGIANGILDIKEGDEVLGWTEIIISVVFLLLSLRTINEYDPITPNKRGGMRIVPSRPDGSPFTTGEIDFGELPDNAQNAYRNYEANGWRGPYSGQTPGTCAGRGWSNANETLPTYDSEMNPITYREFDVNNYDPMINNGRRDGVRFIVGSDGSVWYTDSHYGESPNGSPSGIADFVRVNGA